MPKRAAIPTQSATVAILLLLGLTAAAQEREFRYQAGSGTTITISNDFGSVSLQPAEGAEVLVRAQPASPEVEIQSYQTGNRIEIRSFPSARASEAEARVKYTLQVPANGTVTVRSLTASIVAEQLRGDLTLESDAGAIDVHDYGSSHLVARTISAPITLRDVASGHIELFSVSGDLSLSNVSGSRVSINTLSGTVHYDGGFAVAGEYAVTTHSGNIEVAMPPKVSVEIVAQSLKGRVEDEFHFQPRATPAISFSQGSWFAGTANTGSTRAGAAAARLRSFSGTIRVTKQ
jgi:DUF4097 and DUF4098 domain-containing protein YvlB